MELSVALINVESAKHCMCLGDITINFLKRQQIVIYRTILQKPFPLPLPQDMGNIICQCVGESDSLLSPLTSVIKATFTPDRTHPKKPTLAFLTPLRSNVATLVSPIFHVPPEGDPS